MNYRFFSLCTGCRKKRFFIARRSVQLPGNLVATSKDLFCGHCFGRKQRKLLEEANEHDHAW